MHRSCSSISPRQLFSTMIYSNSTAVQLIKSYVIIMVVRNHIESHNHFEPGYVKQLNMGPQQDEIRVFFYNNSAIQSPEVQWHCTQCKIDSWLLKKSYVCTIHRPFVSLIRLLRTCPSYPVSLERKLIPTGQNIPIFYPTSRC